MKRKKKEEGRKEGRRRREWAFSFVFCFFVSLTPSPLSPLSPPSAKPALKNEKFGKLTCESKGWGSDWSERKKVEREKSESLSSPRKAPPPNQKTKTNSQTLARLATYRSCSWTGRARLPRRRRRRWCSRAGGVPVVMLRWQRGKGEQKQKSVKLIFSCPCSFCFFCSHKTLPKTLQKTVRP